MGQLVQGYIYYLASLPSRSSHAGVSSFAWSSQSSSSRSSQSSSSRSSHAAGNSSGIGVAPLAYHTSIVVFNNEYTYNEDEGVSIKKLGSKMPSSPNFKGAYHLGTTKKTESELNNHVATLMAQGWNKENYDCVKKNCQHFCEELIKFLEVNDLPSFVRKLPKIAEDLVVSKAGLIASVAGIALAGARFGLLGVGGAVLGLIGIAAFLALLKKIKIRMIILTN